MKIFVDRANNFDSKEFVDFVQDFVGQDVLICLYYSKSDKAKVSKISKKLSQNVELNMVEQSQTSEDVVKHFVLNCFDSCVLIKRGVKKLDAKLVKSVIEKAKLGNKIVTVTSKKDDGFFKKLIHKIKNIIFGLVYNIKLFEGSNQLIYFDKSLIVSMQAAPGAIVRMTKVDNYKFVKRAVVYDENFVATQKHKSLSQTLRFSISLASFALLVVAYVLLSVFIKQLKTPIFHVPMICAILAMFIICFVFVNSFMLFKNVGKLFEDVKK